VIVSLSGTLARWDPDTSVAWIEVSGVGYEVLIPVFAHGWIDQHVSGDELQLYTYYHVSERQPAPLLIGFQHEQERQFFRKFIDVPDVGPVKAVRALTHPVSEIARWVEAEDDKALQQLPGIGQRLSQTIVANLHGKLTQEAMLGEVTPANAERAAAVSALFDDAVDALMALQYSHREAEQLVTASLRSDERATSLENLLRSILEQQAPA
jgi:Holliday junction DNA helicase RuvA